VDYQIRAYPLQQGALEVEYIEEFFSEYPRHKKASEIIDRLGDRVHSILMTEAALPDEPGTVVPVSYKIAHEIRDQETDPILADLVDRLRGTIDLVGRRVVYQWIGGTRTDWRGQGHFRALTEEQEVWAHGAGFDEIVAKTKNKFYEMRSALDHLRFEVVKLEVDRKDSQESKLYLRKRIGQHVIDRHRGRRSLVRLGD